MLHFERWFRHEDTTKSKKNKTGVQTARTEIIRVARTKYENYFVCLQHPRFVACFYPCETMLEQYAIRRHFCHQEKVEPGSGYNIPRILIRTGKTEGQRTGIT
jgi:hypothetical protein